MKRWEWFNELTGEKQDIGEQTINITANKVYGAPQIISDININKLRDDIYNWLSEEVEE